MPHLHLETTADLPENDAIPDILEGLTATLSGFETIQAPSVKAYHTLRVNWAMGEGAPAGFVHLTAAILAGRSEPLRRDIADALYAQLREFFAASLEAGEVAITLEVREMDPATYRKP